MRRGGRSTGVRSSSSLASRLPRRWLPSRCARARASPTATTTRAPPSGARSAACARSCGSDGGKAAAARSGCAQCRRRPSHAHPPLTPRELALPLTAPPPTPALTAPQGAEALRPQGGRRRRRDADERRRPGGAAGGRRAHGLLRAALHLPDVRRLRTLGARALLLFGFRKPGPKPGGAGDRGHQGPGPQGGARRRTLPLFRFAPPCLVLFCCCCTWLALACGLRARARRCRHRRRWRARASRWALGACARRRFERTPTRLLSPRTAPRSPPPARPLARSLTPLDRSLARAHHRRHLRRCPPRWPPASGRASRCAWSRGTTSTPRATSPASAAS